MRVDIMMDKRTVQVCKGKEEYKRAIMDKISVRFKQAQSAPVCQGTLFELLGYVAETETAIEILEGTFMLPEGTENPTLLLFEEIAKICK